MENLRDDELLEKLKSNVGKERAGHAECLAYLAEVENRQLHLKEGYPSLFQFCLKVLGLSEASTCKRIQVARLSRKFPHVLDLIRQGKLTMSNASLLAPHLTQENCNDLLAKSEGKRRFDVEKITATFPGECNRPSPKPKPEIVKPISESRTMFVFSGDDETVAMYRTLQDRLRHKYPHGKIEELVKEAFVLLVEKTDPVKEPKRKAPIRTPAKHTRYIPAAIRREVWRRDGDQCGYSLPSGIRCSSRAFLEIDHLIPWSVGGSSHDSSNLALRCRGHNQYRGGAKAVTEPAVGNYPAAFQMPADRDCNLSESFLA